MEYKPEIIFEDRPGFDPNQYVLPLNLNQYELQFPEKKIIPEQIKNSELENKIKDENTS